MTELIKKKLKEEIDALEHELIHELPKEIKKAAALGDLSENAEYHMAKQRQEFVKARVRQLGKRLADPLHGQHEQHPPRQSGVGFNRKGLRQHQESGSRIQAGDQRGVRRPPPGRISTTSPIGRALLNKKVGETAIFVTPNGKREMEILSLRTIHDDAELSGTGLNRTGDGEAKA